MRQWVFRVGIVVGVSVACLAALSLPSGAAPAGAGTTADRGAALRRVAVDGLHARSAGRSVPSGSVPSGPVQAAAVGDVLTITDPAGDETPVNAKADVRQVQIGNGGSGSLQFTMTMETYSDPLTDPAWINGPTGPFFFLDTSGDNDPELIIEIFTKNGQLTADVFDPAGGGTLVCTAVASTDAATKSYTATVTVPGCLGDTKQPAVAAGFSYALSAAATPSTDFAPNDGNLVRFTRPIPGQPAGGYSIVSSGAGFERFGAQPAGSTPSGRFADYIGPRPVVDAGRSRPFDPGLWSVTDNGEVSTQDGAGYYNDASALHLAQPIVGMAVLPDGGGYWLVARDGGIFTFGNAKFYGSTGALRLAQPIVGMAASPTGLGYWLVAADGGIFTFGDATFHGSTGALRLQQPVVGMAAGYQGQGYWLVARDGGIFAFDMPFYGSTGALRLVQPIVRMAPTRSGGGYRFVARDGGVFSFGDAEFQGSGATGGRTDVVGLASA